MDEARKLIRNADSWDDALTKLHGLMPGTWTEPEQCSVDELLGERWSDGDKYPVRVVFQEHEVPREDVWRHEDLEDALGAAFTFMCQDIHLEEYGVGTARSMIALAINRPFENQWVISGAGKDVVIELSPVRV